MPTNGDAAKWQLTAQQEATADLLATGSTITEAAKCVGVARQTVSEWMNRHYGFRATLNRRRDELWEGLRDRLAALLPKAVRALEDALETESADRLTAAVHVLKACGAYGQRRLIGPTNPKDLEIADEREKAARERAAFTAELGM